MKTTIKIEREIELKTLVISAQVRYWEDSSINGIEDTDGKLMPFIVEDCWEPVIDLDTGIIKDWPNDKTAKVHYKICDAGSYWLKDENGDKILSIENDYVPNSLIPGEYGDYIIMSIDVNGKIKEWSESPDISDFINNEDDY